LSLNLKRNVPGKSMEPVSKKKSKPKPKPKSKPKPKPKPKPKDPEPKKNKIKIVSNVEKDTETIDENKYTLKVKKMLSKIKDQHIDTDNRIRFCWN
jgi:hypothetical protein